MNRIFKVLYFVFSDRRLCSIEVIIPRQSELLQAFTSMALGTCKDKVSTSLTLLCVKCVASLLNKMQDDHDLDETLYGLTIPIPPSRAVIPAVVRNPF